MFNPLSKVDSLLNSVTMYLLILLGLSALAVWVVILGYFELIFYTPKVLASSFLVLWLVSKGSNYIFSKIFKAPVNSESASITAFILFFIMTPAFSVSELFILALVALIAMASKYIVAIRGKHIFNPAAFAAVAVSFFHGGASWWITDLYIVPVVLIIGLLIVRKIKRFTMFGIFLIAATVSAGIFNLQYHDSFFEFLKNFAISWPIVFFGTIMFTEPLTTPPTKNLRIIYAIIVGFLFSSPLRLGSITMTHELGLLIGNTFSFLTGFKKRLILKIEEKSIIANNTYEVSFKTDQKINFRPGQYLEWTLPHHKEDSRGARRFFTITSSPTESDIKIAMRYAGDTSSTFKKRILEMTPNDKIATGQLGGDFILPPDQSKKLVFIAGGIGVTPFRSMIKYLLDRNEKRDIVLFYANKTEQDIAYKELFDQAQNIGLKTKYVTGGMIDENMIKQEASDFKERMFYLSGPNAMVENYKKMLLKIGISQRQIVTDYFPGY